MPQYISREELWDSFNECLDRQGFGDKIPVSWDKFGMEVVHEKGELKMQVNYRVTSVAVKGKLNNTVG